MFQGFATDLRLAARRVRLQFSVSAIIVLTLGLAIGASTAIFSVVDAVLLRPLPFPESERLVLLEEQTASARRAAASLPAIELWTQAPSLESVTFFERRMALVLVNEEPDRLSGAMVSRSFLMVMGVAPALGRTFTPEPFIGGPSEVIISHRLWQRLGGTPDVIGRTLTVDPRAHTIVGVMPPTFAYPEGADWWTSPSADLGTIRSMRDIRFMSAVGRLRRGATLETLRSELQILTDRHPAKDPAGGRVRMVGTGLRDSMVQHTRWGIVIVAGFAALLLLIACCNITALLLGRALTRRQDAAVQAALGASPARLVRQGALELAILALVGGALGLAAAYVCRDAIVALTLEEIPRIANVSIDMRALVFAFAVTMLSSTIAMIVPAWISARMHAAAGLRGSAGDRLAPAVFPLLRALVIAEVALTCVMTVAGMLLARTYSSLAQVDRGFDGGGVVAMPVHLPLRPPVAKDAQLAFYTDVRDRVAALPGVTAVLFGSRLPLSDTAPSADVRAVGHGTSVIRTILQQAGPGFLSTIGARIVEGRELGEEDAAGPPVVVINEVLARRLFGGDPAVGRKVTIRFMFAPYDAQVVGVSRPVRFNGLAAEMMPEVYVDYRARPMPLLLFARVHGTPEQVMPLLEWAVLQADTSRRVTVGTPTTLEREVARHLARPRFFLALVGTFGGVGLVLAAAGLYGVLAFAVAQRRHELGVRLALGASPADLFREVVGRGAVLTSIGLVLGVAGAAASARVMQSLLFGVRPSDPLTFAVSVVFVAVVATPPPPPLCHNPGMLNPRFRPLIFVPLFVLVLASLHAQTSSSANWPSWRGPAHNGVATANVPLTWSDTQNVRWKVEIPGRGYSTPVAWGNKLFLTTAIPTGNKAAPPAADAAGAGRGGGRAGGGSGAGEEHRFEVLAIDRESGKTLWQKTATTATPHEGYHHLYGSFASNAPATDGQRVYAFFGSRGLFVYDLDGKLLWQKDLGIKMSMRLAFGEGTGVVVHDGRVFLQFDHQQPGAIIALNAADGKELWRAPRADNSSWSTPLVVEHAGARQLVVTADTKVKAYDVQTGKVVWEVAGLGLNPIPQPVQFRDTVLVMSGYRNPKLMAVKLGRTGDLTGTDAVVWETVRGTSYTGSPALHDGRLYVFSDNGLLSVFNAATGEPHYIQARLPQPYAVKASPLVVNDRVYLATEEGDVVVVKTGNQLEVLATNTLADQSFIASPIAVGDSLFLRSRTHLFRITGK